MDVPPVATPPIKMPSPALSHHGSKKSLRSIRSSRSLRSIKTNSLPTTPSAHASCAGVQARTRCRFKQSRFNSTRSNRSTQSMRIFNHSHLTYHTCFGCIHVRIATCAIGFVVLLAVCLSLVYCVFTSQEQQRPNLKLYALPMILVIVALLYMFVGILQQKPKLLYPFISLQIVCVFSVAVSVIMISIAVLCHTKFILRVLVDVETIPPQEYLRLSLVAASLLLSQLFAQTWALRAVCGCYRYFTDIQKFNVRQAQMNYV